MKILITGVAGFIGSKVANYFSKNGCEVTGVDDLSQGYLNNVPNNIKIGHYHSWVVSKQHIPQLIKVTSVNSDNLIMSVEHRKYDIMGLQFHPESIMTEYGLLMIKNWVNYSQD